MTAGSANATKETSFSLGRIVARSLTFYSNIQIAVILSVAAATAVIVGALVVGDSVRGSLRFQAIDRLGNIDGILVTDRFLDQSLVTRIAADLPKDAKQAKVVGAFIFPRATAEFKKNEQLLRAGSILVVGCDEDFWGLGNWELGNSKPSAIPQGNEVVLNQELADELNVAVGEEVTLRLPNEQAVPADSPLGRREGQTAGLPRLKVVAIIPTAGLGRFDLRNNQRLPRNAYVSIELIRDALNRPDKFNAILASFGEASGKQSIAWIDQINQSMKPQLRDLGLRLTRQTRIFPDPEIDSLKSDANSGDSNISKDSPLKQTIYDYYSLSADQMLLPKVVEQSVIDALPAGKAQPLMTYLANAIEKVGPEDAAISVPYSTITGADSTSLLPLLALSNASEETKSRNLKSGEVLVNQWLADRLQVSSGDTLRMFYFLPETVHGKEVEKSIDVKVVGVVPITAPATGYRRNRPARFALPPTLFNDSSLTPEVPGVTDQDSISDWDLPFVLTRKIDEEDDRYWNNYRLAPKLFLSFDQSVELFGSRFGEATSLRIDTTVADTQKQLEQKILEVLAPKYKELGLAMLPIKQQAIAAAAGTTPFDGLFLGLSMLVIVAALMLVTLLFRLGIERRADQWGLLLSMGWGYPRVRQLLLREGLIVAMLGALLGIPLGLGYAYLMLAGLRGWWVGAVAVPFLQFYATQQSLVIGWIGGVFAALFAIFLGIRMLRKAQPRVLLTGRTDSVVKRKVAGKSWLAWTSIGMILGGVAFAGLAFGQSGQAQGGMFVGGGMLLLVGGLILVYHRMVVWQVGDASRRGSGSYGLMAMALRSVRRNPLRSVLSIGLLAITSFLLLSMSVFQIQPSEEAVGGFDWIGESSQPIYQNVGDAKAREEYLGESASSLSGATIFACKMRPGDEASCNNLYVATEPRVIGLPTQLARWDSSENQGAKFPWLAVELASNGEPSSPWSLLESMPDSDGSQEKPVPVILDQNTAMWSLHLRGAIGEIFSFEFGGKRLYFKTVGLLSNSLLQGSLLIGESNFQTMFPDISGYQFFLARNGEAQSSAFVETLEKGWGDEGLDLVDSYRMLDQLLAVQNTYLKAFQTLGALGLLLGTIGLATVQLRSVWERRGELALLRSIGFSPKRVGAMIFWENSVLLLGGIAVGAGAAAVSVAAPLASNRQVVELLQPAIWLLIVLVVGFLAGALGVRGAMKQPLIESLRDK